MRALYFVLGLLVGAIAGATVVLLTTPQSGQDIQDLARSKMDYIKDEGRRAFETRKSELEKQMADIKMGKAA